MAEQKSLFFDEPGDDQLLGSLQLERPLIIFDLETTGTNIGQDRIVQFAFLRIHPNRETDEWTSLVNPGMPIPPGATAVHHITDDMVKDQPAFADLAPMILDFLENADLSGFNVARFDVPFLQTEMQRAGFPLDLNNSRIVDAMTIFHKKEPRDLTAAVRFYCDDDHVDAHDAMGDVRATLDVLHAQLQKYQDLPKSLDGLHKYCTTRDSRFLTIDRKFAWKDGEAVITFGKHRGVTLKALAEKESDYLQWMLNGDFAPDTKALIADALDGIFPTKEKDDT